jgi:hypothetical protein
MGYMKPIVRSFFDLNFDHHGFGRVEGAFLLENRGNIRPSVNVMFNNGWV